MNASTRTVDAEAPRLKVLIADDDPDSLAMLGVTFRSLDCEVQLVNKVRNLRFQLRTHPDVVVIDLMMPDRDGVQVIEAMARARIQSALIIISSVPDRILKSAENFARMSGLRVLGALRKPLWTEKIREVLEPLRSQAKAKPDLEEQEFFRLLETGHLAAHYQPVVDSQRARLHAVEIVPRVHHPRLGVMSPSGMWDTAEAFGAARAIKAEMIIRAVDDAARFRDQGAPTQVQVEVPAAELRRPEFSDEFLGRCRSARVLPSSLCIAMTEADLREDFVPALGTLTRLAMRGVQLAIDDYGSGSLTGGMLSRLPISELKLNGALVAQTLRDSDARCRAIDVVAYGKRHDIDVVARNVDTPEHLGLLMDLGVRLFQGPIISGARSFEETLYWVRNVDQHLSRLGFKSQIRG